MSGPIGFFYADGRVESREAFPSRHAVVPERNWPDTFEMDEPPQPVTLREFEVVDFVTGAGRFSCFVESSVAESLPYRIAEGANAAAAVGKFAACLDTRGSA